MTGASHDPQGVGELRELLRTVPLFSGLQDADLDELVRLATRRHYARDGVIFFEKDVGASLFMIERGRIKVSILGDDGREVILSVLGPGDFFGEMALLDDTPRSADARVHEKCRLLVLSREAFEDLLFLHKDLAYEVLWSMVRILSSRLRETTDKLTFLSVSSKF